MEHETRGAGPHPTGSEQEAHEALREERPRIYVASLSDYNAGVLHGVWLDADQDLDGLQAGVTAMLRRSPTDPRAEEVAVHDYEHFGLYRPREYGPLDWLQRVASGITEHGPAFSAWAAQCDHDEDRLNQFDEAYLGEWDSTEDYADELIDDLGYRRMLDELPGLLGSYVRLDTAALARDLELGGDLSVVDNPRGGVWLFQGDV